MQHIHAQVRRLGLQGGEQPGHAQLFGEVGQGNAQLPVAAARVEAVAGAERLLDLLQRRANRPFQGQGAGGGAHASADPHQQRITEHVAQARQGVAHCRLGQGQTLGSA
ncbi:hypothetical protein D3C79_746380 [compost metagenome]